MNDDAKSIELKKAFMTAIDSFKDAIDCNIADCESKSRANTALSECYTWLCRAITETAPPQED